MPNLDCAGAGSGERRLKQIKKSLKKAPAPSLSLHSAPRGARPRGVHHHHHTTTPREQGHHGTGLVPAYRRNVFFEGHTRARLAPVFYCRSSFIVITNHWCTHGDAAAMRDGGDCGIVPKLTNPVLPVESCLPGTGKLHPKKTASPSWEGARAHRLPCRHHRTRLEANAHAALDRALCSRRWSRRTWRARRTWRT